MPTVRDQLTRAALDRGLRQSTLISYETLLKRLELLDLEVSEVSQEAVLESLWTLDSPNTRRATVVALRAVLGWQIKIPKGVPKRYDLPDEDTLRMALMLSTHEVRGLLMMYGGLRIGEACAITRRDVQGDRLRVDKQVLQLHRTGHPTVVRVGPVKSTESDVVIPQWLAVLVDSLETTVKPDAVRESLRRSGSRVGIKLNPHLLRHWMATTLLERGVPMSVVTRQMRHSDVATTLRTYSQTNHSRSIHDALG